MNRDTKDATQGEQMCNQDGVSCHACLTVVCWYLFFWKYLWFLTLLCLTRSEPSNHGGIRGASLASGSTRGWCSSPQRPQSSHCVWALPDRLCAVRGVLDQSKNCVKSKHTQEHIYVSVWMHWCLMLGVSCSVHSVPGATECGWGPSCLQAGLWDPSGLQTKHPHAVGHFWGEAWYDEARTHC